MKTVGPLAFFPGIALCLILAVAAWGLGLLVPLVGAAVFALAFGILARLTRPRAAFDEGIRFTGRNVLRYSVILLGFQMQIGTVLKVGGQSLFVMLFTLTVAFAVAALVSRLLRIQGALAILIGVGTAICGGSAIAATAPVIRAKDEDVAQSISTIFLFNILAVLAFPLLGRLLHLSDRGFGIWAGTAINDTSSVLAAAAAWGQASGIDTALSLATIVKLTRTLMIVPITVVLSLYVGLRQKGAPASSRLAMLKTFPWFVLGFVAVSACNSAFALPPEFTRVAVLAGKFMIVMAMCAIGLSTDLKKLIGGGGKPLLLGLCCWLSVALVSLLVQRLGHSL